MINTLLVAKEEINLSADETNLVTLLRGRRLSDRKLCQGLGMSQGQAHELMAGLRAKLNVNICKETLRDAVKRAF